MDDRRRRIDRLTGRDALSTPREPWQTSVHARLAAQLSHYYWQRIGIELESDSSPPMCRPLASSEGSFCFSDLFSDPVRPTKELA
jgi:hypothetical protein